MTISEAIHGRMTDLEGTPKVQSLLGEDKVWQDPSRDEWIRQEMNML